MNSLKALIFSAYAFGFLPYALRAQCDPGITYTYATTYVYRIGPGIFMGGSAYSTGADARYVSTTLTICPLFNGQAIESNPSSTVGPNQHANPSLSFEYTKHGFGIYTTTAKASTYDSCKRRSAPPFQSGAIDGTATSAQLILKQPIATFDGSSEQAAKIYADHYPQQNPNGGSTPVYPTVGTLNANNNNGITGTKVSWVLSGRTQAVDTKCVNFGLPCQSMTVQTNSNARSVAGCQTAITAFYTIDGLTSNSVPIMIVSARVQDSVDPRLGQHAVHLKITGGYESQWYFQDVDSCGTPLAFVQTHERFPNGFTYQVPSNWNKPTANSWYALSDGTWHDTIGFYDLSGTARPTPSAPQSPLNATAVFSGTQEIYIDPIFVKTVNQVHYIDHGGYQ